MSPETILGYALAAIPGILVAGGALVRISYVEKGLDARVTRELFDVTHGNLASKIDRIERMVEGLYRANVGESSGSVTRGER